MNIQQKQSKNASYIFRSTVALAAALLALGGCQSEETPSYHPQQVAVMPAGSLARAWLADLQLKGDALDRLIVREDFIYAYSKNHRVSVINRKAGTMKYVANVNAPDGKLYPPVELGDTTVFPTGISLELYNPKGELIRSVPLKVSLRGGAVGSGTNIYICADDPAGGRVQAIDLSKQAAIDRWNLLTPGGGMLGSPVLYSSILYVGTENAHVYAVSEERKPVWSTDDTTFVTGGPIVADLVADDYGLYVSSRDTKLYCVNRTTGKLRWQYFAGAPLAQPPAVTVDTVYLPVPGVGLVAIDKANGTFNRAAKWTAPGATQFLAQDDKYAYLREPRGEGVNVIVAIDKQTGARAFESVHHDFTVFGTNIKDNTIFAGYPGGQLLAIKPVLKAGVIGEMVLYPVDPSQMVASN